MRIVIDAALLIIIIICSWNGSKKGLVNSASGILAMIVALFVSCLLSASFSGEAITALRPFVNGYVETQSNNSVLDSLGINASGKSLYDAIDADPGLRERYCEECFKSLGIHERRADDMAQDAVELIEQTDIDVTDAVVEVLCQTVTYVFGVVLAFALMVIIFTVISNLFNLSFRIPGMPDVDSIGGIVAGFVKGFLYCVLLCWLLSYCGLIIGKNTLDNTLLGRFFLMFEFITGIII